MKQKLISSTLFAVAIVAGAQGAQDYYKALNLSTKFFGAQRCGNTHSWIHDACHTQDNNINGVDLSGGWHDCGDHVKFGQTNGYAASLLLHSYLTYPASFQDNYSADYSQGAGNGIADVLDEVKIYTDYALKTLTNGKLYYQVGNPGNKDSRDDHYSGAEPVYQTNNELSGTREAHYVTEGASNIAGINAAVLAMMSVAYREHDAGYANSCLNTAKAFLEFGDKKHAAQSSVDRNSNPNSTYVDETWADEMAFGALELFRATGDENYVTKTQAYMADSTFHMPTGWVLDYPTVSPLVVYNYLVLVDSKDTTSKSELITEVDNYLARTKFQNKFMIMVNDKGTAWGTSKYAASASYMSLLLYNMTKKPEYLSFAKSNTDFLLGDHTGIGDASQGFSFLVEYGTNYPDAQVHHRAAADLKLSNGIWEQFNSTWHSNPKTLTGALVGGPADATADSMLSLYYANKRSDYYTNEVCIYYNAPFVATLAALIQLNDGVANTAPTLLRISNQRISSDQDAGAFISTISATDRDLDDTHTFSVISGSENFTTEGNQLKTAKSLAEGNYDVVIRADDGNGGNTDNTFTITVSTADIENNALYELGWYSYTLQGATVTGPKDKDNALVYPINIEVDIPKEDAAAETYPGVTLAFDSVRVDSDNYISYAKGSPRSFSQTAYIILEYASTNDFKMVLPLPGTKYDEYSLTLPNTQGTLILDTIELSNTVFQQAGWGTQVAFDKSKMYTVQFSNTFYGAEGSLKIETIVIDGFKVTPTSPINMSGQNALQNRLAVSHITAQKMQLTVPSAGQYQINVYSLNGKRLNSVSTNLKQGINSLAWEGSTFKNQLILIELRHNSSRIISKTIVR